MSSKRFMYFNVPTWSQLLFVASATNLLLHASFPASVILLKIVL